MQLPAKMKISVKTLDSQTKNFTVYDEVRFLWKFSQVKKSFSIRFMNSYLVIHYPLEIAYVAFGKS